MAREEGRFVGERDRKERAKTGRRQRKIKK